VILYTRDGSEPTERSACYNGEFFLVSSTTVKARAFASGFASSPVTSESYTLGGSEDENPGNAGLSGVQLLSPGDGEEVPRRARWRPTSALAAVTPRWWAGN
jgi:hypothetical protein